MLFNHLDLPFCLDVAIIVHLFFFASLQHSELRRVHLHPISGKQSEPRTFSGHANNFNFSREKSEIPIDPGLRDKSRVFHAFAGQFRPANRPKIQNAQIF
jgi:hypothetical protein